jgi:predicted MFS family arabinose efflux permease
VSWSAFARPASKSWKSARVSDVDVARGFPARLSTRLSFLVAGLVMASWAPQVPYAKARLGLNESAFGLLLLCLGIGSVLAMQVTGAVVARVGSRPIVLISGVGLCLTLPWLAYAGSTTSLAACLLLFGASIGSIDVAMNVHAVEVERAAAEPLMSGFHGMYSLGGLVGAAGGTALLSSGLRPVTAAGVAAFAAAVLLLMAAPGLLRSKSAQGTPLIAIPRGIVILIGALAFVAFLTEGAILDWSALLLTGSFGVPAAQAGIGYALFSVAMAFGRLTGDRIVKRLGQQRTLLYGGLVVTAGFVLLLSLPSAWVASGGFLLIGLGAANLVPILFSTAGRQSAMSPALAIASMTTLGYAGILIGPAAIGFIASVSSLRAAFVVLALIMLGFPVFRGRIPTAL